MELALIKYAVCLAERVGISGDQLEKEESFKKLVNLVPAAKNDLLQAWKGDVLSYNRTQGKGFESLFALMMDPKVFKRKYNVDVSSSLTDTLRSFVYHALPDVKGLKGNVEGKGKEDEYGIVGRHEDIDISNIDTMIFCEELRKEIVDLLAE